MLLTRPLNECLDAGVVLVDFCGAWIYLYIQGKVNSVNPLTREVAISCMWLINCRIGYKLNKIGWNSMYKTGRALLIHEE